MNVLVLGAGGMAGSMISKYLTEQGHHVMALYRKDFDTITDEIPDTSTYDYVINCIGLIKQKSNNDELFFKINSEFPHKLEKKCDKLIHISSDCVFSGTLPPPQSYASSDKPDAEDAYGKSKAEGEPSNSMVIRTSIIGPAKDNYGLFEWFKNTNEPVKGFTNHYWSGVTTLELANYINKIISGNLYQKELFQLGSPTVSKYGLLCMINEIFELNKDVTPFADNQSVNRSLNVSNFKSIKEQLIELKEYV